MYNSNQLGYFFYHDKIRLFYIFVIKNIYIYLAYFVIWIKYMHIC